MKLVFAHGPGGVAELFRPLTADEVQLLRDQRNTEEWSSTPEIQAFLKTLAASHMWLACDCRRTGAAPLAVAYREPLVGGAGAHHLARLTDRAAHDAGCSIGKGSRRVPGIAAALSGRVDELVSERLYPLFHQWWPSAKVNHNFYPAETQAVTMTQVTALREAAGSLELEPGVKLKGHLAFSMSELQDVLERLENGRERWRDQPWCVMVLVVGRVEGDSLFCTDQTEACVPVARQIWLGEEKCSGPYVAICAVRYDRESGASRTAGALIQPVISDVNLCPIVAPGERDTWSVLTAVQRQIYDERAYLMRIVRPMHPDSNARGVSWQVARIGSGSQVEAQVDIASISGEVKVEQDLRHPVTTASYLYHVGGQAQEADQYFADQIKDRLFGVDHGRDWQSVA